MNTPVPYTSCGDVSPTVSWRYFSVSNPVPVELGAWAQLHKLHARGSDSTALNRSLGATRSTLKRIWSGQKGQHNQQLNGANIWVLYDKTTPIGVVVFESSTVLNSRAPTAQNFCVNMWLNPAHRQRGIMGEMLREVSTQLQRYTANPATRIQAGDASIPILAKYFTTPIDPLVIFSDTYPSAVNKKVRY